MTSKVDPALSFVLTALEVGVDHIEVRDASLTLIRHHYNGVGDKQQYVGSRSYIIPTLVLEHYAGDLDDVARQIARRLSHA